MRRRQLYRFVRTKRPRSVSMDPCTPSWPLTCSCWACPSSEKILRPIVVYVFLIFGLRLAGRREMAQLNPFDLVVLLTISNTVQNAIIGEDNSVTGGIIGAATLLIVNHCVVKYLYTHEKLDRLIEGDSCVLIENGVLNTDRLKLRADHPVGARGRGAQAGLWVARRDRPRRSRSRRAACASRRKQPAPELAARRDHGASRRLSPQLPRLSGLARMTERLGRATFRIDAIATPRRRSARCCGGGHPHAAGSCRVPGRRRGRATGSLPEARGACSRSARSRSAAHTTPSASCRATSWHDGVWTVSAGNAAHGRRVRGARKLGARCSVMVMDTAPDSQDSRHRAARRVDRAGHLRRVLAHGRSSTRSDRMSGHFVHPFDDDRFIAGNGTVALEILEDLPDVDAIVAPLGGGGLLVGHRGRGARAAAGDAALRAPNRKPRRRSPPRSRRAGRCTLTDWTASFVDGAGGKSVLETHVAAAATASTDRSSSRSTRSRAP